MKQTFETELQALTKKYLDEGMTHEAIAHALKCRMQLVIVQPLLDQWSRDLLRDEILSCFGLTGSRVTPA